MKPVVALLTDFGAADHYVGSMKAVLLSKAPDVQIVDITHQIPPQNIRAGAFQLLASYKYHPKGTIFIAVVDPGVGSERKIIYAEADGWRFIAPDNGLLSWVFNQHNPERVFEIKPESILKEPASRTFHGRDIMAPLAGELLSGVDPRSFGTETKTYETIPFPTVKKTGSLWRAEVISVDSFGNLITNLHADQLKSLASHSKVWFEFEGHAETIRGLSENYAAVSAGKLLAIEGSSGFIEISVRDGNAANVLKLGDGGRLSVHLRT